jgi:hypothetical protein
MISVVNVSDEIGLLEPDYMAVFIGSGRFGSHAVNPNRKVLLVQEFLRRDG